VAEEPRLDIAAADRRAEVVEGLEQLGHVPREGRARLGVRRMRVRVVAPYAMWASFIALPQ
jgi:hypothetical protein